MVSDRMQAEIAVIGGSGVYKLDFVEDAETKTVETPYGESPEIVVGKVGSRKVAFMQRHGKGHTSPPHLINYRANIKALEKLGVKRIIATTAAGSLNSSFKPGEMVLLDQFIDFTKGRTSTFYEGGDAGVFHVDFTEPYCPELRETILKAGKNFKIKIHSKGTYVCTEGPRFETAAEIKMAKNAGGDIVGMTNVPECVLARELEMCYSAISVVTNFAAGISKNKLTHTEVANLMEEKIGGVMELIVAAITEIPPDRGCNCSSALKGAKVEV